MNKIIAGIFIFFLTSLTLSAQDTIPHVKGDVIISVKKGTISCDLTLSNLPRLSDYYLRLNSGMNIRYIKNAEPFMLPLQYERSLQDSLSSGESSAYYIPAFTESGKYLPHAIRFSYLGMYPVITDTSSASDWRGNIAFNGKTLRADGIQSAWCPILYDVKKDTRYDNVTYDLNITCEDCKVIYLNGSQPVSGTHARLSSNKPQDLTMFLGDYRAECIEGDNFLNPDADMQQLSELDKSLHAYQSFLANNLTIPYKGKTTYIQTTPVSKNNSWLFASYPTIVKVGWGDGMKSFANKEKGVSFLQYMSHELAHYYFGTVRDFNSEIGDMISEGFAEYLSLQITQRFFGDSLYMEKLQAKVRSMRSLNPIPVARIRSKADYVNRELYVYYYAPLLFTAIAKEIGEAKMWEWMKSLLLSPTIMTNFSFFGQTLKQVVNNPTMYEKMFDKYLNSDSSFQHVVTTLQIHTDELQYVKDEKQVAKTYYYFFFSRPLTDIGSSQNRMIVHTDIGHMTCTPAELSKMARPIGLNVQRACKNDSGSTSDFNIYYSLEDAKVALNRWLDRFNKSSNMLVKIVKL